MQFVSKHLDVFLSAPIEPQGPVGRAPAAWLATVAKLDARCMPLIEASPRLFHERHSPETLRRFYLATEVTSLECFVACMAWGGMRYDHGAQALQARQQWLGLISKVRTSILPREELFEKFLALRPDQLPHVGIAYFTKLLHFLRRGPDAYILDQWTAKSVNLLTGRGVVHLMGNWVDDSNTARGYEKFCTVIECLSERMREHYKRPFEGGEAERALMSQVPQGELASGSAVNRQR